MHILSVCKLLLVLFVNVQVNVHFVRVYVIASTFG